MEAKSGHWIKNIYISGPYIDRSWNTYLPARLNSKFMVMVTESREGPPSCHIYDLEAIRNPSSKECLLTTITVRYCSNDDMRSLTTFSNNDL